MGQAAEGLGGPITVLVNNASIFDYDNIHDRHPRKLGPPYRIEPARALRADAGAGRADPRCPSDDANGELVAQGLVVNMVDQRVRQADAGIHDLYDCQDGTLGVHPDGGTGTGARRFG